MKFSRPRVGLSEIFSLFALLISVTSIILAQRQLSQLNAVQRDRTYFGSYMIGRNLQQIKNDLRGRVGIAAESSERHRVRTSITPIEYSLGLQTGLQQISLKELENSNDSGPGQSSYFDAIVSKYEDSKMYDAFYLGQGVGELTYGITTGGEVLTSFWTANYKLVNGYLDKFGLSSCPRLDTAPNRDKLDAVKNCVQNNWVLPRPTPTP